MRGALIGLVLVAGACGARSPKGAAPAAALRVVAVPETARVSVDERFAGAARVLAVRPKEVAPGTHRVTVEAAGYFPHDLEVALGPGVTTIEVALRAIPP